MASHILPKRCPLHVFSDPVAPTRTHGADRVSRSGRAEHRRRAGDRRLQVGARRPVLHAREVQPEADVGRRPRQPLLARHPAGADDERLPDARVADVRVDPPTKIIRGLHGLHRLSPEADVSRAPADRSDGVRRRGAAARDETRTA